MLSLVTWITCYSDDCSRCSRQRVKREAGETPARLRHCEQRVTGTRATVLQGMGRPPVDDDLPARRPALDVVLLRVPHEN